MGDAADEHDDSAPDPDDHDDHDDHDDDHQELRGAPPDPLDRVWLHPTELPAAPKPRRRRRRPSEIVLSMLRPLAIGAVGAFVAVAVLAATGAFDDENDSSSGFPIGNRSGSAASGVPLDAATSGVVLITVRDQTGSRRASGVSVRHSGEILTSARAIGDATTATVTTAGGETLEATVVGRDTTTDLALLAVDSPLDAVPVAEDTPDIGAGVWILGGPMSGTDEAWRTSGIIATTDAMVVTSPGPTFSGLLETDAPSSPAAAGGALVDGDGLVTGIVLAPAEGRSTTFVLPISVAIAIATDLRDDGIAAHGELGLVGTDSPAGPVVTTVEVGGPSNIEILPGDVIVAVEGRTVLDMGELTARVRRYRPDTSVEVSLVRAGKQMAVDIRLASTVSESMTSVPVDRASMGG